MEIKGIDKKFYYKCLCWARVLLGNYPRFNESLSSFDYHLFEMATHSAYVNTYKIIQKIINRMENKKQLIKLIQLIDCALNDMQLYFPEYYEYIKAKYIKKKQIDDVVKEKSISRRTYFRYVEKGEYIFGSSILMYLDGDETQLKKIICDSNNIDIIHEYKLLLKNDCYNHNILIDENNKEENYERKY